MNNWLYLIVSITLKNRFSKIEIIKDPSRNRDGILPSVSMETKLRVFSLWFLLAVAETTLPGLAWPVSTWYLSLPANVWKSTQLTFTLGVLEVALSPVVCINLTQKWYFPVPSMQFLKLCCLFWCVYVCVCLFFWVLWRPWKSVYTWEKSMLWEIASFSLRTVTSTELCNARPICIHPQFTCDSEQTHC